MAETQQPMSSNDAGNATGSSSKVQRARGVSGVQDVSPKINQADLFNALDSIIGLSRQLEGCSVGRFTSSLEEPLRSKMHGIMRNPDVSSARLTELLEKYGVTISSDVMRRHRRRLMGKDGCKCSRES
jgi:hypothetical protein